MLKLMVTTCNGQPPGNPIVAEFTEQGGNIGRSTGNTLVLPDAQRYISRTHAAVFFRAGLYLIKCVGTASPVFVNDWQLGAGQEAPIGNGDEIRISGYSIRVFADKAHQTPMPTSSPIDVSSAPAAPSGSVKDDPLAAFGGGVSHGDPFADLIVPPQRPPERDSASPVPPVAPVAPVAGRPAVVQPATSARPVPTSPARGTTPTSSAPSALTAFTPSPPTSSTPSAIPEDFDPFADSTPAARAAPARLPDDFDLGMGPIGNHEKIDDIFGLAPGQVHDPFKSDAPLGESLGADGNSASLDPLVAMGLVPATKPPPLQPQRDNTPAISGNYRFPTATFDTPSADPHVEPGADPVAHDHSPEAVRREPPTDILRAFEGEATAERLVDHAAPEAQHPPVRETPATPVPPLAPVRAAPPVTSAQKVEPPPVQAPVRELPASAGHPSQASADELLKAYLQGAGVPDVNIPGGLTPELMHILGQLLRESTQGTVDLLRARAFAKRQLRTEVTMIVARENNPLKFSPTVEGAMEHLLAPQGRGFMTPVRAIKDAYNDLRSHEVGFVAGMRAALSGVLARFNPAALEKRLAGRSVLDSLLPMNRQARLWSLFEHLYTEISAEAEDNFQSLFGREFVRAYEEQIAKLEAEEKAPKH